MTTIVYRNGELAADTCITHEDHEPSIATSRTSACKVKSVWPGGQNDPRIFIASKGDVDAGTEADQLILDQFEKSYRSMNRLGFRDLMNFKPRLAQRVKAIGEGDYGALIVVFERDKGTSEWSVYGAYEVTGSGKVETLSRPYIAIGCDKAIALGALHVGASARDAVRAAAAHGVYTAMPIHVVHVNEMDRKRSITFTEVK